MSGGCKKVLKIIFCPLVLIYYSFTIYLFPCIGTYLGRAFRGLFSCCFCNCCRYTDDEMKADASSICSENPEDDRKAVWVRMPEIDKSQKWALFSKKIDPSDVGQGALGDCWLMSQIAVLATRPDMVRKVFITQERSVRGKYQIRLWDCELSKHVIVTVDDYVPCRSDGVKSVGERGGTAAANTTYSPLFAQPQGPEMWVMLLEKAYAKYCADMKYGNLRGGASHTTRKAHMIGMGDALRAFTGGNAINVRYDEGSKTWETWANGVKKKGISNEELHGILLAYVKHGALMTACCDKSTNGLVGNHAYSIMDVKDVSLSFFEGKRVQLVRLRNPWGGGEWKGAWSDSDSKWKEHADIKKEVGWTNAEDGAFYMELSDFAGAFTSVQILEYDQGIDSFTLDVREDETCGTTKGCCGGCCTFWGLCRGCGAVYCPQEPSKELRPAEKRKKCCGCC